MALGEIDRTECVCTRPDCQRGMEDAGGKCLVLRLRCHQNEGRKWDPRVYNRASSAVKNVSTTSIRIAESRRLYSLRIGEARWSTEAERMHSETINLKMMLSLAASGGTDCAALGDSSDFP